MENVRQPLDDRLVFGYSSDDLAQHLGISYDTLRRWIRQGKFPEGKRSPRGRRWTVEVIERWMATGQASTKALKLMAE